MYEVDFLPVEAEDGPSSKSGDAIALRFTEVLDGRQRVVVIDAGFKAVGQDVVDHVSAYYDTDRVDLLISTHPDADHLNGLQTVVEQLRVSELLVHLPRRHSSSVNDFSNLEAVDGLVLAAKARGTTVTEPFTGLSRFGGQVLILGPTWDFYEAKLAEHLDEAGTKSGVVAGSWKVLSTAAAGMRDLLSRGLSWFPAETWGRTASRLREMRPRS